MSDSIPLKKPAFSDENPTISVKSILILFILFLFVVSDVYTNSVLCNVSGALTERNPTNLGIILQGVSLVVLFVLANYLVKSNIL
jgi:capsule polysaccharide export protein KpsE/RkpR